MELKSSSKSLGDFNKIPLDAINHIFMFLGNEMKKMGAINVEFHTILCTTPSFRYCIDQKTDCLLSKITSSSQRIKEPEDDSLLSVLYDTLMKKPMSDILILDQQIMDCQKFLNGIILNVLCQLEIFGKHFKNSNDEQRLLLRVTFNKFINEFLMRLTITDATFSCIAEFVQKSNVTAQSVLSHINSAKKEIQQQSTNSNHSHGVLMRLITAVSLSWNLLDESTQILRNHHDIVQNLCKTKAIISRIYSKFVETKVRINTSDEDIILSEFIKDIQAAMLKK